MSEQEPKINLNVGGTEYELRRDNSELYTYVAQYALFNHVFLETESEEEKRTGMFLPSQYVGYEVFNLIATTMLKAEFPARINQPQPSDSDMDIITRILAGKVEDTLPEDWSEV